jgi:hypothetical protein
MPRLIRRNRALRKQDTATLQEWLRLACRSGHADAVLALELELSARDVYDDAPTERRFPVYYLASRTRAATIQQERLQEAVRQQSYPQFRDALLGLEPAIFLKAWELAREFIALWDRAQALRQIAYWIACYYNGYDEGVEIVNSLTESKAPAEVIEALENNFADGRAFSAEVNDA